jgi:hypothetical protein
MLVSLCLLRYGTSVCGMSPPPPPFLKIRCTVGFELCVEQELRYEDMTAVKSHV